MFRRQRNAKRFTLLLLEEEEDYLQDWVGECTWPTSIPGNWQGLPRLQGRIRIASRSLFFEPDDVRIPIVRIPYRFVSTVGEKSNDENRSAMFVTATACTKMKANLEEVPYTYEKGPAVTWIFTLSYATLEHLLVLVKDLLRVNKLPKLDMLKALEDVVSSREESVSFDPSRLVEFDERMCWRGPAVQLTPLTRERGRLVVSDLRVYFQPLHNLTGGSPVRSHPLSAIAAVARQRSSLQPVGLEIFFIHLTTTTIAAAAARSPSSATSSGISTHGPVWDQPSAFFAFRSEQDREAVLIAITSQPSFGNASGAERGSLQQKLMLQARGLLLEAESDWLRRVTAAWQHGKVSNFDYLLYLNLAAGRSFNDLCQWPVYPWVLRNYTGQVLNLEDAGNYRDLSKPVGALNPDRLADFRKRYKDMMCDQFDDSAVPAFMYGTHYSTPGYVMFWLLRAAPAHMLKLQNGRFDAPDRLFSSIQEAWESVNTSTTDVKELIPEFFIPQDPDFLLNLLGLPLGVRQNGEAVEDVVLPPWACLDPVHNTQPSPAVFLAMHRAALESNYVSSHLHSWVDLVFGYKQRGQAAVEADNVFYHLTYEGAVDLQTVKDELEVKAFETQINEFGQTPKQLFKYPHPPRLVIPATPSPLHYLPTSHDALPSQLAPGSSSSSSLYKAPSPAASSPYPKPSAAAGESGVDQGGGGGRSLALALLNTLLAAAAPEETASAIPPAPALEERMSAIPPAPALEERMSATPPAPALEERMSAIPPAPALEERMSATPPAPALEERMSATPPAPALEERMSAIPPAPALEERMSATTAGSGEQEKNISACPAASCVLVSPGESGTLFSQQDSAASMLGMSGIVLKDTNLAGTPALHSSNTVQEGPSIFPQKDHALSMSVPSTSVASVTSATDTAFGDSPSQLQAMDSSRCWGRGLPSRLHQVSAASQPNEAMMATLVPVSVSGQAVCAAVISQLPSSSHQRNTSFEDGGATDQRQPSPSEWETFVYCVGEGGLLRVLSESSKFKSIRSVHLDGDLMCMACQSTAPSATKQSHPLLFVGAHTGLVHLYSVDQGRLLGSWQAHNDSTCCLAMAPGIGEQHVLTSSWDCSVKIWDTSEGRLPWLSGLCHPSVELREFESGVWAVAVGSPLHVMGSGHILTGTEEGVVQAWDVRSRSRSASWTSKIADDYVGGVSLDVSSSGLYVAVATADGYLSLLDMRMGGSCLARAATSSGPLRCCLGDAGLCIAGSETGAVQMWDVSYASASGPHVGGQRMLPSVDGLYPAWQLRSGQSEDLHHAITSLSVIKDLSDSHQGGEAIIAALSLESGHVALIRC
ncbi:hypothetical protein CEUSTIGMA_g3765.t1 [Chlamydomonas eustigma]|uniref:BEACH domain-containing protein n=1 Tax=Chlamydomonas eustigma TaxID=1157962 RepID=A0A250X048_9CHLO|nr:hypothetical protein CEUSTIGMA_g3765.t1 [Chlamydomonas eustigma]|eukprot:GAX76319.1 hypothetical protein CEUSTIGMA_g3765.t1 [Chlamydomonas eustigma]